MSTKEWLNEFFNRDSVMDKKKETKAQILQ